MKLLVIVHEAAPGLVHGQGLLVGVVEHVLVVLPRDGRLDLHYLALGLGAPDGHGVRPAITVAAALADAGLAAAGTGLERTRNICCRFHSPYPNASVVLYYTCR
jgi:hypothetical protein